MTIIMMVEDRPTKYSDIGMFDDLATDIIYLNRNNTSDYLLMGDFNAKTQTKPDFVLIYYDLLIDLNI